MLVLSRRINETLLINDNIRFTVLGVSGNQVRIGIEAPSDVIVLREEIVGKTRNGRDEMAAAAPINSADHHGKVGRYGLLGLRRRRQ